METESVGTESPSFGTPQYLPDGSVIADRYEIRGVLGSGGYAVVYLAFDRQLGVEVALKALRSDRSSPAALVRFRREVNVARGAASPHLVRIYDIGVDGDLWYLTMEVVRGQSLRERLRGQALDIDEAVTIATGILHGLAVLHEDGVVHRDVKPENILLSEDETPKLADFGLVRFLDDEAHATATGAVIGTTDYISPEQALDHAVDARSDLFSLGVVLFEMLAGRLPFEGESSLGSVLARLRENAPNVRRLRRDVPFWLSSIVARLLAKDPARRYASATQALTAFDRRRIDLRTVITRRVLGAAAAIALVAGAGIVFALQHKTPSHFQRLAEVKGGIAAIGSHGEVLWRRDRVNTFPPVRYVLARIERERPPVLATVLLRPGDFSPASRQTLSFIDPYTGKTLREVQLPNAGGETFRDDPNRRDAPDRYQVIGVHAVDFDHDGIDEIVVAYMHVPEAGSYIILYEPLLDRSRTVFVGRGGYSFAGVQDIDGDGRPEIIVAGINNGFDWFNCLAAVRVQPWIGESFGTGDLEMAYAPDLDRSSDSKLLWFALLPRGIPPHDPWDLHWDQKRRVVSLDYGNRAPVIVTFDGFLTTEPSALPVEQRQQRRREAYAHARETSRLLAGGYVDEAVREAREAVAAADTAGDSRLVEWMQRALGRTLIAVGSTGEGEALLERVAATSENASEVSYEAGLAFHFRGDIDRAVAWYKRAIGRGAPMGVGKSKHELIQAIVFALGERGEWKRALDEVDTFDRAYGQQIAPRYREFIRWRSGGAPNRIGLGIWPTDLTRYWSYEFRNANDEDPAQLLPLVEHDIVTRCEPVAPLWSLKAALLARLGRTAEAAEAAQRAWQIGTVDAKRNLIARGHLSLIRERLQRYANRHS